MTDKDEMTSTPQVVIMSPSSAKDDSIWKMIQTVVILYLCFGIICYFMNKDWWNALYIKPWNIFTGMFAKK